MALVIGATRDIMYTNVFDSHCHYDDEWFDEDRASLFETLPKQGVTEIVTNATDLKTLQKVLSYCESYPYIYGTAGIHPECLKEPLPEDYLEQIAKATEHKKIVAIGEIGLDYHWDTPKDIQMKVVKEQLVLAKDLDMPVIFHDRDAHGDSMELLKAYKPKGLVHCFSGSVEMLKEVLRLGMYISLGGVVTFKNARVPVEVAKEVPMDRLLLETDAPYLAPTPMRGKRNDSTLIPLVAEKIAQLRGMTAQEVLNITRENAKRMYNI